MRNASETISIGLAHEFCITAEKAGFTSSQLFALAKNKKMMEDIRQVVVGEAFITLKEKFALLFDLGVVTIPRDYNHSTQLASFRKKYLGSVDFDYDLTDENFQNPSRVLKPGDKFHVRVFKQIKPSITSTEERMAFLDKQNAVYLGAQGVSIVFEQRQGGLPAGYRYYSFDRKSRLYKRPWGTCELPYIGISNHSHPRFSFTKFEEYRYEEDVLLCFCEVK